MAIGFASLSSTLQGTYCFTMGGVSTFLSCPTFTRVSLAVRTGANLPSLPLLPSVSPFYFSRHVVSSTCSCGTASKTLVLSCRSHKVYFCLVTSPRVSVSNKEPDIYGYDGSSHPNNETLFRTKARSDHLMDRVICAHRSRCGLRACVTSFCNQNTD